MHTLVLVGISLVIAGIIVSIFLIKRRETDIKRWLTRRSHYEERQDYVVKHHHALMDSLREHHLTIYIDDALDESHRVAEEKYAKQGLEYLWYLEKSYELVRLTGHTMPFNNEFAQRLIYSYCLVRYQLLREVSPLTSGRRVISYLYEILQPRIDRETRVRQRALNK